MAEQKQPIVMTSSNGVQVTCSPKTQEHIISHGENLIFLMQQSIAKLEIDVVDGVPTQNSIEKETEFKSIDRTTSLIKRGKPVSLEDEIWFAFRSGPGRSNASIVFPDGIKQSTSLVSVVLQLKKNPKDGYFVRTAFYGPIAPKELGDTSIESQEEFDTILAFWRQHTIAYDPNAQRTPFRSTLRVELGKLNLPFTY